MPIQYPIGPAAEARACRNNVGLFDVSHMGQVRITGDDAFAYLQFVTTNDIAKLSPGQSQYSLLLTPDGGVVDDIIVYRFADREFLIVLNAGCKDKDVEWLTRHTFLFKNVTIIDESDKTGLIAVQGPKAVELTQRIASSDVASIPRFAFANAEIAGVQTIASRTGYTGEDGFELFCAWDDTVKLWNALSVDGGAAPCGLASRDVLRIEAAYSLYGHEIGLESNPIEAGLGWAVKTKKPAFIGRDAIVSIKKNGAEKALIGVRIAPGSKGIPREGCEIFAPNSQAPIGSVTSGTLSPNLGYGIAIAKVAPQFAQPNLELLLDIRGRRTQIITTRLPFYRNGV